MFAAPLGTVTRELQNEGLDPTIGIAPAGDPLHGRQCVLATEVDCQGVRISRSGCLPTGVPECVRITVDSSRGPPIGGGFVACLAGSRGGDVSRDGVGEWQRLGPDREHLFHETSVGAGDAQQVRSAGGLIGDGDVLVARTGGVRVHCADLCAVGEDVDPGARRQVRERDTEP